MVTLNETPTSHPRGAAGEATERADLLSVIRQWDVPWVLYAAFLVLVVVFAFMSPVFLSGANLANIGRQTAMVSIMAVGMTFVIISGEIDLSVGSTVALAGMVAAVAMDGIAAVWYIGVAAALLTGLVVGLVNGYFAVKQAIPSFLVTLGMLGIARGLAMMVTGTRPVVITDSRYYAIFGEGSFLGVPAPILWTVLLVGFGYLVLQRSVVGNTVLATGGNRRAARFSGINTDRVRMSSFALSGALAGFAALILTARSQAARPNVGEGIELDVIAAVILGGTSLYGGKGTVVGALIGSLMIGVINNGLVLLGVASAVQLAIKGAIIVAAVAFSNR